MGVLLSSFLLSLMSIEEISLKWGLHCKKMRDKFGVNSLCRSVISSNSAFGTKLLSVSLLSRSGRMLPRASAASRTKTLANEPPHNRQDGYTHFIWQLRRLKLLFLVQALKCTIAVQHNIEARVNLTKAGRQTGYRERRPLRPSLPQSHLVHSRLPAPGGQRFMRAPSSTRRWLLSSQLRFASFCRTNKFRPELHLMDAGVVEVSENLKKVTKGQNWFCDYTKSVSWI